MTHNRVGKSQAQAFAVNCIYRFRLVERGKSCICCLNGRIFDVDATESDQNELLIYSHFIQPTKLQPAPVIVECLRRPWPSRSHKLHCLKLRHVGTVYACKFRQSP